VRRHDPWADAVRQGSLQLSRTGKDDPFRTPEARAAHRYELFRKMFCAIAVARRDGLIPAAVVTAAGARNQFNEGRGSRSDRTEGAHSLPRQVRIGGRSVEEYLRAGGVDEVFILNIIGAEGVNARLPEAWNKADSLWEMKGLAEAFRRAVETVVRWDPTGEPIHAFPVMWALFHSQAGAALADAIRHAGPDDRRAGPLQRYLRTHLTDGRSWDPQLVKMLLGMSFRDEAFRF
jgi:hypothetical protein